MRANKSESALKWGVRIHFLAYVLAVAAQIVLWWILTPDLFFWPLWSILGWGVGLAFHVWSVRSPARL